MYSALIGLFANHHLKWWLLTWELKPGSRLFVYTDGLPEANNAEEKLFGVDRMLAAVNKMPEAGPEELLKSVRASVDAFVGDAPQFDDLTMLCLRYLGPAGGNG